MVRRQGRVQAYHLALGAIVLLLLVVWGSSTSGSASYWEFLALQRQQASDQLSPLAVLSRALDKIEQQPVLDYEEALKFNELSCAGAGVQSNPDQVKGEVAFWRSLTAKQIQEKRSALTEGVRQAFGLPGSLRSDSSHTIYPEMWGEGRGIVYTGGNADTLQRVYTSLRILRNRHACKLPVEIFAFPEEMTEASGQGLRGQIESLGDVTFKELHSSAKLATWKKGESIVKSSFAEVLYLDSDNILLADPTYLFDHPMYKERGAVFWPDITKDGPANPIWRILNMQCRRNDWQFDSGQIIIDKVAQSGLNLAALVAASVMQEDHDFWFKISGGDKDTFRYAFYALDLPYTASPHWLSSYGTVHNYPKDGHTFCGLAMFQYSLSPADWIHFLSASPDADFKASHAPPLFVHANLLKHSNGYARGQALNSVKRIKQDKVAVAMDASRSTVYTNWQGMCVDIWDGFDDLHPRQEGTFENGDVILESGNEAFGGVLKGFEEMYYAEGGKAGGF